MLPPSLKSLLAVLIRQGDEETYMRVVHNNEDLIIWKEAYM